MMCGDVRAFGCDLCSVRKGSFCVVYCRLEICLLLDFDGCCVGLILVFVFLLASHD